MHPITKKIKLRTIEHSLDELCELLGYEKTYLSSLINGKGNFPFSFLAKVSIKLDLDLDELQYLKDENTK
jgi:transcriptional regulator with XRE-family HTH domain